MRGRGERSQMCVDLLGFRSNDRNRAELNKVTKDRTSRPPLKKRVHRSFADLGTHTPVVFAMYLAGRRLRGSLLTHNRSFFPGTRILLIRSLSCG